MQQRGDAHTNPECFDPPSAWPNSSWVTKLSLIPPPPPPHLVGWLTVKNIVLRAPGPGKDWSCQVRRTNLDVRLGLWSDLEVNLRISAPVNLPQNRLVDGTVASPVDIHPEFQQVFWTR